MYSISSTKTVINRRYKLDKSFQGNYIEMMHGLIKDLESHNTLTYRLLVGSSYINLPFELKHQEKD